MLAPPLFSRTDRSTLPLFATALALLAAACGNTADPESSSEADAMTPALSADTPVIFITGSTSGLGREAARALAADGAHIIVHGRNVEAGNALVDELNAGPGSARFFPADLASMAATRELARAVLNKYDRLDAFVSNAGIFLDPADGRRVSDDGHELHFHVNYLAGFLLTRELLPLLRETAAREGEARIIQVASVAQAAIDFDDVTLEEEGANPRAYSQSKLAQIMFTRDLAEELESTGVLAVSLHPATLMDTGMVLDRGIEPRASVEEGLEALLNLVRSDGLEPGGYYRGLVLDEPNAQASDREARERLRLLSEELTGVR
ncbi:MAG: SDR family NAD(P)-dependent oxidoreductase [Gemmatimonadota bacterium]